MLRRVLVGVLATAGAIVLAVALGAWLGGGPSHEPGQVATAVVIDIPEDAQFATSVVIAIPEMPAPEPPMQTASLPDAASTATQHEPPPQDALSADSVRAKLQDQALRKGAHEDDLAALDAFYTGRSGPALWVTETGLSPAGQAVLDELGKADDWGLESKSLNIPAAPGSSASLEQLAAIEIALSLAVLHYARDAKGGRTTPKDLSKVIDQELALADPDAVLADIATAEGPDEYLRALHPKHEQFQILRQALIKARADGAKPKQADIDRLIANMERWRWMPPELGPRYVQINVPEFMAYIVKDGKTIHEEKVVVGKPVYATPVFSADMKTIVFNPEWTVPPTVIKEDLLPRLRKKPGTFESKTAHLEVLKQHRLKVRYNGKPVDPAKIDWRTVNMGAITFIQPPGPKNALGKVKFLYPNEHAVYMHDTLKRDLLKRAVRVDGHHCPRVANPGKFAGVILAEDQDMSTKDIDKLLATGHDSAVELKTPIPVHTTYFTAVADADGKVTSFGDVYKLDAVVTKALGKTPPQAAAVAAKQPAP
jgi:murein L,D-transpeptidase YcbB/YkuD